MKLLFGWENEAFMNIQGSEITTYISIRKFI